MDLVDGARCHVDGCGCLRRPKSIQLHRKLKLQFRELETKSNNSNLDFESIFYGDPESIAGSVLHVTFDHLPIRPQLSAKRGCIKWLAVVSACSCKQAIPPFATDPLLLYMSASEPARQPRNVRPRARLEAEGRHLVKGRPITAMRGLQVPQQPH